MWCGVVRPSEQAWEKARERARESAREIIRSIPTGFREALYLQPVHRVCDVGCVLDGFNFKLQLINTNTLMPETAQGTISVGSKPLSVQQLTAL